MVETNEAGQISRVRKLMNEFGYQAILKRAQSDGSAHDARMFPLPMSVLNGGHVGSDYHVINPLYSTGEWSVADVFALPPEGFLD